MIRINRYRFCVNNILLIQISQSSLLKKEKNFETITTFGKNLKIRARSTYPQVFKLEGIEIREVKFISILIEGQPRLLLPRQLIVGTWIPLRDITLDYSVISKGLCVVIPAAIVVNLEIRSLLVDVSFLRV